MNATAINASGDQSPKTSRKAIDNSIICDTIELTDVAEARKEKFMAKIKFVLLLPVNYNDGTQVAKETLDRMFEDIFVLAGGYYIAGEGDGAYKMKDGEKQVDRSLAVWIAVEEEQISELQDLVGKIGAKLGQETMYLERTGGSVEFIPPFVLKG